MRSEDDDQPLPLTIDFALWRRIAAHGAAYRGSFVAMAGVGLVVATADVMTPLITASLIDGVQGGAELEELVPLLVGYGVVLLVIAASVFAFIELAGRIATGIAYDLRKLGFARLQTLSFSFHDAHPVGWLVARLTSDTGKVSGLLPWMMLDFAWGSSLVSAITVAMFWLHAPLALVVCAIAPPLVLVTLFFQRRMLESSRAVRRSNAQITSAFNEAIMGVRTTKSLVLEEGNLAEFQGLSGEMFAHSMRNALQAAVYLPVVSTIGSLGVGLALWQGGLRLDSDGLTLGVLVAFMQYVALFMVPVQEVARTFTLMQSAQAAAERVQSLLETEPSIKSPDAPLPIEGVTSVRFDSVSFAYKAEEPVLRDVSFTALAGQTVALVGPTGGGKSTVVKLLSRFYDVNEGAVRLNEVDVRDLDLDQLQSQFGIVQQSPHLFSGTIADNIRYGRLDATDDEVQAAAELVRAHPFVLALPDGYASEVGEGGARLSTGQRQLIALARAVLADPAVFIMDEATSSIDTETERAIQVGVEQMLRGRIALVVAHRLSTIEGADLILFIDEGRIVESGSHAQLMAQGGRYAQLRSLSRVA